MKKLKPISYPFLGQFYKVKDLYPIGLRFDFLGLSFIVIRHRGYDPGIFGVMNPIYPAIITEYADFNGIIREKEFGEDHWGILLAMKPKYEQRAALDKIRKELKTQIK